MKKISIIIPCYNVEQYIAECLASVFEQNMLEQDFEVLIINDGSTDQSQKVAEELSKNKSNVRIISQQNKGLGGARNTGIKNATGDYLLFLDADDRLFPMVIEDLLNIAQHENLDILEFSAQGINEKEQILYRVSNKSPVFLSGFDYYNSIRYMNSACNKLYKRNFLIDNDLLFLEKIYIEDFEFNTRCFAKVQRIQATDLLVAHFLQSQNSITRNKDEGKKKKMVSDIIFVLEKTKTLYQSQTRTEQSEIFFLERLNFLVATLFYQLVKNKANYKELKSLKEELQKKEIFFIHHRIFDFGKNVLRIVLLKNLWTYPLIKLFFK
jgi:glycosyltransferase involved in cell wall biosynthesis